MALWLFRAGRHGEHESRFFESNRVCFTWEGLEKRDMKPLSKTEIRALMRESYPDQTERVISIWTGEAEAFVSGMSVGDWIVVPRKSTPALAFGEITGDYGYDESQTDLYCHSRSVKWLNLDVPRSVVDQDLLYSFSAMLTICEISRNDAEARIRHLAKEGWKATPGIVLRTASLPGAHSEVPADAVADLETLARDRIAKVLEAKYKGHGLARLVEAILKAQGYTTYRSPEGPDRGIDILAAAGPLGFGNPRICVQVKSTSDPTDMATVDRLIGTMQNVHAEQGLFVSWGGFKTTVRKDGVPQFFRVRLWDQRELLDELFAHYDELDEDIRAELPLKKIWTLADEET